MNGIRESFLSAAGFIFTNVHEYFGTSWVGGDPPHAPPPLWIRHCQEFDGGLRKDEDREFILTRVSGIISFIVTSLLVHTLILLWTLESGRKLMYAKSSWCGANVPIVLHVFGN